MRKSSFNYIPLVLLAMAFALDVRAALRPQTPLLQVCVTEAANQSAQFVSFLPTNKNDLVWADDSRKTAWLRRVAGKMGIDRTDNIALLPFPEPFHAVAKEPELEFLLQVGMVGSETLSTTLDSGGKHLTDNRFRVVSVSESGVSMVWERASQTPLRLRCEQGAGGNIWFVSSEELETRWAKMLEKGDGATVRRELNLLLDSLERESTSIGKGDREGWREWLFEFKERTPAAWPSIVFQNVYFDAQGKPGPVVVTCCGETSPEIPPNGTWTKTWANWTGRPETPMSWTFRAPEECLLDDDFDRQVVETWSPKGGASNVLVQVSAQPKQRPFLVIGSDVISVPDIWAALAPSGDENQICDMQINVVYKNGTSMTFSGARGATRRPLPNAEVGTWNWKVELLPNTEIREVVVSSASYFAGSTFHLDKPRYKCGETAHVRKDGKLGLLPWPALSVRNESDFPVDYELSFQKAEEGAWTSALKIGGVKQGESADFNLSEAAAMKDLPATNVTVRIVGSAPGANEGRIDNISLNRGGRTISRSLKMEYMPIKWIELDDRLGLVGGVWSALVLDYTWTRDIRNNEDYFKRCQADIFKDATFKTTFDHVLRCQKKNCPDCSALRKRISEQAGKIGGAAANVRERWNRMVPEDMPHAQGHGADMVALLLALCDEYYEVELDWDPLQKQDYENIAKRLCGEWP